jgi:hypothetical protein
MVALEGVAQFLDLLGGAARLVDEPNFDLQATEADFVVGLGQASSIELIDNGSGARTAGLPKDSAACPERKVTKANLNTLSSCAVALVLNEPWTPAPATKAAANLRNFMIRPPNLNFFYCCGRSYDAPACR